MDPNVNSGMNRSLPQRGIPQQQRKVYKFSGKPRKPKKDNHTVRKIVFRVFLSIISFILILAIGLLTASYLCCKGPSPDARDTFVRTFYKMSAMKWLPRMFFSQQEIDLIVNNEIESTNDVTDVSMVSISKEDIEKALQNDSEWADAEDGILIKEEYGDNYRAYVMLIRDPSRVFVGTSSNFKTGAPGLRIFDAMAKEGAVAAINAGGFPDPNGVGDGRYPEGLTISKGELLWGGTSYFYNGVIGFTNDNILVVGNMTGKEALDRGVRDCVCFGPILIVNGEAMSVSGGSLNPRTAIGQRADGTVIFLCADGRMASSLGASYADLISIMLKYGAVNAANLDGGSSTHMYYKGEPINVSSSLYGPRRMPTFFMVR